MTYTYLFDNNIYQRLTRSTNGVALYNFNKSIKDSQLENITSKEVTYKMTPFTLIEALGIIIPDPKITIPKDLLTEKNTIKIVDYLILQSKKFFSNTIEIKRSYFLEMALKQTKYISYEAKILEKMFIYNPLSDIYLEENIINYLAFDYLCKYEFPSEIQMNVFRKFLVPSFFTEKDNTTGLSKFRIAKRLWDIAYHDLIKKSNYPIQDIEEMNKSMRLKKYKDFVDCELIHMACVGNYTENKYSPVVAFTCDDEQIVIDRVMAYRSILQLFNSFFEESFPKEFKSRITIWKEGVLVFCNIDGSIKGILKVAEIEAFL